MEERVPCGDPGEVFLIESIGKNDPTMVWVQVVVEYGKLSVGHALVSMGLCYGLPGRWVADTPMCLCDF